MIRTCRAAIAGGALSALCACGGAGSSGATDAAASAAGQTAIQQPASDPGGGWPMFGGDLENSRDSPRETRIAPSTVAQLALAWRFDSASTSSVPAVVDGVVYLPTWGAELHALATDDGRELWSASLPHLVDSSPAVSDRRVFVSDGHGFVHALARGSGALEWSQQVDLHPEAHLWSSPIYIPDIDAVVVGVASYEEVVIKSEMSFRGSLVALDAASGRERWRLPTTDPDAGDGPGIAIWSTVAVDRTRGALYVGTGNNYAPPASELSDALLAVDYAQGSLLWKRQLLPGDVFSLIHPEGPDYDIGSTANLFAAGGRELVGIGSKSGAYVALGRDDGAVAWTAQVTGGGFFGGIISPAAHADGTLFVLSNDPATGAAAAVALDAGDGREIWRHDLQGQSFGGVAHANGVVFVGDLSRRITALDAATGAELWSDLLPDIAGGVTVAAGMLLVSFGYPISVGEAAVGAGGVVAYRLP